MALAERVGPVLKSGRGFFEEFKAFIRRGNVIDLAVAVIIGAAFTKIVGSLVADLIMPPIGLALDNVDLKDFGWTLKDPMTETGPDGKPVVKPAVVLSYGKFLQALLDFLLTAFCVFLLVKVINRIHGPPQREEPKPPPEEVQLLREIRDLLKSQPTAAPPTA